MSTFTVSTTAAITPLQPIRILICDDHEVVREGLRTLLAGRADLEKLGLHRRAEAAAFAARRGMQGA